MKPKTGFKNEEEFEKAVGMKPVEFARFIREKTTSKVDRKIAKLKRQKKFF